MSSLPAPSRLTDRKRAAILDAAVMVGGVVMITAALRH